MLYVAFSRVKRRSSLKVLQPPDNLHCFRDVVWKEVLNTMEDNPNIMHMDSTMKKAVPVISRIWKISKPQPNKYRKISIASSSFIE
ncbi:hypothetical protein M0804_001824 [Polistes exclamans]|nr:hypothetical protein M0804_001824 [Polistes exclamans]